MTCDIDATAITIIITVIFTFGAVCGAFVHQLFMESL